MKNTVSFCATIFLSFAACAATVQTATRDWVRQVLRGNGIYVTGSTETANADGTVTITSPFTPTNHPDCVAINLTVVPPGVTVRQMSLRSGVRLMAAAAPAAQADDAADEDPTISITIQSGSWVDKRGNVWAFDFGPNGYTWTYPETLPDKPDTTHTCDINSDCVCKDSILSNADKRNAAKELYPEPDYSQVVLTETWFNFDDWPEDLTNYNRKGQAVGHFVVDQNGLKFAVEDIALTDAYKDAVLKVAQKIMSWYEDCYNRYCLAHTCDHENPQHDWGEAKTCGSTWKTCNRNQAHKEGTPSHVIRTFDAYRHYCACGEVSGTHLPVGGNKQIRASRDGWTMNITCAMLGCGYSAVLTHDCKHEYCMPCSAGDGCDLPCPTCNGSHTYSGASKAKCSRCKCYGCGAVEITLAMGATPVGNRDLHGGWGACDEGNHEDPDNERSTHGKHCICQCGYNSCETVPGRYNNTTKLWEGVEAEQTHSRTQLSTIRYDQKTDEDGTVDKDEHWKCAYSDCVYCKDPYGVSEGHTFADEETPKYKNLNNEKCALQIWCNKCDYKRWQDEEDASGHSEDATIPAVWKQNEAGECVKYMTCSRCKETFFEIGEHVRNTDDECKCEHGCGYQFEHEVAEESDACGNDVCALCGKLVDGDEKHIGMTDAGNEHKCACQKKSEGHTYGPWREIERTALKITYERVCVKDGWGGNGCAHSETKEQGLNEPTLTCTEDAHVALTDACGCACGYYNKTETDTTGDYHHWDDNKTDRWGNIDCMCSCGAFHRVRVASTYQKNMGAACDGVCAFCDIKAESGINVQDAPDETHTPRTGGHCGCLGGHLTADGTNIAKFHIRKPGTCQCLGADGSGGKWHFRAERTDCPSICAYSNCFGGEHLVSASEREDIQPEPARPEHHTRKDTYCGCKCGKYNSANFAAWTATSKLHLSKPNECGCYCDHATEDQLSDFHKKENETKCKCECGAKVISHYRTGNMCYCECTGTHVMRCPDGLCEGVCHGNNHGAETDDGYAFDDEAGKNKHTPDADGCGCECGQFGGEKYNIVRFHHFAEGECRCSCYEYHRPIKGACANVCTNCHDRAIEGFLREVAPNGISCGSEAHTFVKDAAYCGCKCGEYLVNENDGTGHRYANEQTCYCRSHDAEGEEHTSHTRHIMKFVKTDTTKTDTQECAYCHSSITRYYDLYKCSRCNEEIERTRLAAHGCNKNEEKCVCGCTESQCRCNACVDGKGTCELCGKKCGSSGSGGNDQEEGGNETGGNGGVWDI